MENNESTRQLHSRSFEEQENFKKKKNVSVICFQKTKMGSLQFSINTAENGNAAGLLVPGFLMQPVSGERPEVREKGAQGAGVGVGMGVVGRGGR